MSDVDEHAVYQDGDFDDNAHQACYIFRPFAGDNVDDRPTKKRKVKHTIEQNNTNLPLLCHGDESELCSRVRLENLQRVWNQKQDEIDLLVSENDAALLNEIQAFAATADTSGNDGRLSTGLVVSGPDSGVQHRLFSAWQIAKANRKSEVLVSLTASSCPSIQISLKTIIKSVLVDVVGLDGYTAFLTKHKRLLPMNFDLELLQLFVQEHGIERVVVSFVDVETFDTAILSHLLWSLSSWCESIPFIALLGIATTVELFESRLPKSTVEVLSSRIITLTSTDDLLYRVFATVQYQPDNQVFLGPSSLAALHELSQSQGTTVEGFVSVIKVAFMSHFFATSLSVLACGENLPSSGESTLCTAVRGTDSFRTHCDDLVEQGKSGLTAVRSLLNDDAILLSAASTAIGQGQESLRLASQSINSLRDLYKLLGTKEISPFLFDIESYNCLDDLTTSAIYKDIVSQLRKITSNRLCDVLQSLESSTISHLELNTTLKKIQTFQKSHKNEHIRIPEEKPTVSIFQPTKSPTKSTISPVQKQYTTLVESLIEHLTKKMQNVSFDISSFMHEAFIIDSRQLLLSLSTPRPRHVLERALAKPADYLGCECSAGQANMNEDENPQSHSFPPTSILYHLLQEAGTIINVRDLFDAFRSQIDQTQLSPLNEYEGDDDDDDDNADRDKDKDEGQRKRERMALCLFYRSLSELKMLGMVKSSTSAMTKKRALASESGSAGVVVGKGKKAYAEIDFVAKTSWAGL